MRCSSHTLCVQESLPWEVGRREYAVREGIRSADPPIHAQHITVMMLMKLSMSTYHFYVNLKSGGSRRIDSFKPIITDEVILIKGRL